MAAHLAQRVQTIHAGQPDVEQDEIRARRGDLGQAVLRRGGRSHPIAGAFQGKGQAAAQQSIVVDEENLFGHGEIVTEDQSGGEPAREGVYFTLGTDNGCGLCPTFLEGIRRPLRFR